MKKLEGGCSCGEIRYRLLEKPIRVHCCHCSNCQRQSGSAFAVNAVIETEFLEILKGSPETMPVPREAGPHEMHRCRKCGIAVWSDYGAKAGLRFIRVGTLDNPSALKPDIHIYTKAKQPWVKITEGVPAFKEFYRAREVWPKAAFARMIKALKVK